MRLLVGAVVICAFAMPNPIRASIVHLTIDPQFGSTESTGATAVVSLEFFEQGDSVRLRVAIENTTPTQIGSRLTAIGIELPSVVAPIAFAPLGTSGYFDELTFDVDMSPGWLNAPAGFDVVISSDGNLLGGNPNGAPRAGESQTVVLDLGDTGLTPSELAESVTAFYQELPVPHVVGRFQAVGPGGEDSDKVAGMVPEPSGLALLLIAMTCLSRRRSPGNVRSPAHNRS